MKQAFLTEREVRLANAQRLKQWYRPQLYLAKSYGNDGISCTVCHSSYLGLCLCRALVLNNPLATM